MKAQFVLNDRRSGSYVVKYPFYRVQLFVTEHWKINQLLLSGLGDFYYNPKVN